jgi:hypothetical protein
MRLPIRPLTASAGARTAVATVALCFALILAACAGTLAPTRTLPTHIKRVYIPEFRNQSRQYGVQAPLTLAVNDMFMSDGRLDVVQKERADVVLEGRVKSCSNIPAASSGGDFPLVTMMAMVCVVELWDPYDTDRVAPAARYTVQANIQYISDLRRSTMETETDARQRLCNQMALNIVQAVMTGTPEEPRDLEKKAMQKWRERHNPAEREPVMNQPRYPKPPNPFQKQN